MMMMKMMMVVMIEVVMMMMVNVQNIHISPSRPTLHLSHPALSLGG